MTGLNEIYTLRMVLLDNPALDSHTAMNTAIIMLPSSLILEAPVHPMICKCDHLVQVDHQDICDLDSPMMTIITTSFKIPMSGHMIINNGQGQEAQDLIHVGRLIT